MRDKKKKKLFIITFLLNSFLFALTGFDVISDAKVSLGLVYLLASFANLIMGLSSNKEKLRAILHYIVLFMNVLVALSLGIDSIVAGKNYIQYAWFLAALMSLIALILQWKRRKITEGKELQHL